MPSDDFTRNRLADAVSPYLRQHANNPVHWQPWNDVTLAHARDTDTPILLSIGYSACHWCHVMAHECFEDPAIAAAMNAAFVNIKLDREERPDIDRAYQLAQQAMNGRGGGWPLTCFLDPQDLAPFFVGTYFPPTPRHGLPGFAEVLSKVRAYFDVHRDALRAQATQLREWMQVSNTATHHDTVDAATIHAAAMQRIAARFDRHHGGSIGAPKFPHPAQIEWLLEVRTGAAHDMAQLTLTRMATRGLQDHLGGGFFRYCVDADWTIPHFEKMLYDNAQLLPAYARAATASDTGAATRAVAQAAACGIVDWLDREMTAPSGAFYSSLDADSEHQEGKFYLWTRDELRAVLDAADVAFAEAAFGLDAAPNFEGRAWHLLRDTPIATLATGLGDAPPVISARLDTLARRLLAQRARRARPARDDKILTAWNALAISGLARTARLLDDARSAGMATRALAALRDGAWIDGQLHANVAAPAARIPGFLDDHAFLLNALLEAMQLTFKPQDLALAIALAEALLDRFEDHDGGGFWFSAAEHATPLARGRDWQDDALPNGNAVAIRSLLRLGHLVGNTRYIDVAARALRAATGALQRYPDACPTLLRALDEFEHPRLQLVVRCTSAQAMTWQTSLREGLRANDLAPGGDAADVFVIAGADEPLPGILAARIARNAAGTAYICTGLACREPIGSPAALTDALRAARA